VYVFLTFHVIIAHLWGPSFLGVVIPASLFNLPEDLIMLLHTASCLFCYFFLIFAEAYCYNSVLLLYDSVSYFRYCFEGMISGQAFLLFVNSFSY
jgi:hypothetical protein